jgi:hypothetical protein
VNPSVLAYANSRAPARVAGDPRPVSSSRSDGKLASWIASNIRRTFSRASPAVMEVGAVTPDR